MKKNNDELFDVTMGSHDGAEVCELVGLYILDQHGSQCNKENIGLYRDDGLEVFENVTGLQAERIKKDIQNFRGSRSQNCYEDELENSRLPRFDIRPF